MTPGLQEDDRQLVARFLTRRDEEAFRLLFRRYSPRLLAMAQRLSGGGRGDAEDVVQEAWTRAARQLATFEWRSALSTWLQSIVINCARERWRTKAQSHLDASFSMDESVATDQSIPKDQFIVPGTVTTIDLERAIGSLAPGFREILVLHDVEGYTHVEIAELCGITEGTSKSQLSRARRAVRARLAGSTDEVTSHARR